MKNQPFKTALAVCLMVMLLSSCGNLGADSGFSPIYINKDDQLTDETARQILQNNEYGKSTLGWHSN